MAEYITKFNEFLVRCDENESDAIVTRFHSGLREDLRRELFLRDIFTLEHAYQFVKDLDRSQSFHFTKHTEYMDNANKITIAKSQPSHSQSYFRSRNMIIKTKEFTVSHLAQFNRINILTVKNLVALLHNARVKQELRVLRLSRTVTMMT